MSLHEESLDLLKKLRNGMDYGTLGAFRDAVDLHIEELEQQIASDKSGQQ